MRKLIFIVLLLAGIGAQAQSDSAFATVRYKLTHISDTTWPENPVVSNTILYLGKKLSMYTDYDREQRMKANGGATGLTVANVSRANGQVVSTSSAQISPEMRAMMSTMGNIYKDMAEDKTITMENTNGKLFAIAHKSEIDWTIQPDTRTIMGLQCQKAVADFKGRRYEAWFAPSLPYSYGPWKLNGLPGLIIEAADTKREVIFSFGSFENLEDKTRIAVSEYATKADPKEFQQYKDAIEKDRQANIGGASIGGRLVMDIAGMPAGNVGPDGQPIRFRKYNNPIEKTVTKK